jgi:hypothetical protein
MLAMAQQVQHAARCALCAVCPVRTMRLNTGVIASIILYLIELNYLDLPVYRHCRLRTEKPKKPMFSLKMLWQPLSVCHPLPTPPTAAPPTCISRTHTTAATRSHTRTDRLDVNVRETLLYCPDLSSHSGLHRQTCAWHAETAESEMRRQVR